MTNLKSKLHYYLAEKNWGVKREYAPYINAHKDKYEGHRIRRLWLLFRLNWHYRILRSRERLLPLPQIENNASIKIEDVAYRLPPVLTDSVGKKRYEVAFCAYRPSNRNGGPGAVNAMCRNNLGNVLDGVKINYYFDEGKKTYPKHLQQTIKNYSGATKGIFFATYFMQNKLNVWSRCDKKNDVFFVCHDVGSAYGAYLCGRKFVLVYHQQGSLVNEASGRGDEFSDEEKNLLNKVEETVMKAATTVYFPSDGAKNEYLSTCAFDYSNVHFGKPLYNTILDKPQNLDFDGVADEFGISKINREEYLIFLTAGDYNSNKGIDRIPDVLNEYAKRCSKKILWIVAGDKQRNGMFEQLQENSSNWNFKTVLCGARIPHEKILALMELCDFYIMLHRNSIFDLSTLEAMRAGLVPILSDVGGNPEFNREKNVILINPDEIENSVNKILACDLDELRTKNKYVFENYFSKDNFTKAYTDMLKEEMETLGISPRVKSAINKKYLSELKNKYAGETVVICGNGESLKGYKPIAGAKHIALNKALWYENVKFDMHFMQDYPVLDTVHTMEDYKNYDCDKFYGVITNPEFSSMGFKDDAFENCKRNVCKYELAPSCFDRHIDNYEFDLENYCIADAQSVLFSALQFAVFAGFKKILLVGIDFSNANYDSNENKSVYSKNVVDNLLNFKAQLRLFDETIDLNVIETTNKRLENGIGKYDDVITVTGFYNDLYQSVYEIQKRSCKDNFRFDWWHVSDEEWESYKTSNEFAFFEGNIIKTKYLIEMIKKYWGKLILICDADVIYLKSINKKIREELGDKDTLFLKERLDTNNLYERAPLNINIGFVLIRCNERTLNYWEEVQNRVIEKKGWDQEEANLLLLEKKDMIKWDYFSDLFSNGNDVKKNNVLRQCICTSCGTVAKKHNLSKTQYLNEILKMTTGRRKAWFDGSSLEAIRKEINNKKGKLHGQIEMGIHNLQLDEATKDIQKYISEYDNNLETVCNRLGIAILLDKLGYKNPEITKGMELYIFFQENDVCNLKDYFSKAKSIAIVGNSGRELGKNKGTEIDSHDIVIRFNNFPVEGYEKDYGTKTNVWVRNTSKEIDESRDIRKFDYVIFDPHIRNIWYDRIDVFLDWIKKYPEKIKCITYRFFKEKIVQDSGISYPSSGLMIIYILTKYFGLQNIDVYGFSFLDENVLDTSHYYDNLSKIDSIHKEFKTEQDYLRSILVEIK